MNNIDPSRYTPMMQQYLEIKKDYTDYIVFFRLGDFYEMFFTDAILASKELEIVLTGRDAGVSERVPMCGVPYHAAGLYIDRLIEKGYKVAIVEQVEDPSQAKGIVKRDVIQLITPGTIIDPSALDERQNHFIGALAVSKGLVDLAYCDLTTGQNHIVAIPDDIDLVSSEIMNLNLRELIVSSDFNRKQLARTLEQYPLTLSVSDEVHIPDYYRSLIQDIYDKDMLHAFGRLINYLLKTQKRELMHLQKVVVFESRQYLRMDHQTIRNLELIDTIRSQQRQGTLLWLLDHCETAMGSRMLKQNILRPMIHRDRIVERHQTVEAFNEHFIVREEIRKHLSHIYDLERIIGRVSFGTANAKDLVNLSRSLRHAPEIFGLIQSTKHPSIMRLAESIHDFTSLTELIDQAIVDDPPFTIKEGGMIRAGYSAELDEIHYHSTHGKEWLEAFETAERERTGIRKLKIGSNRVFGYYIEVTKSQIDLVKPEFGYERKQTLANSERFITDELKQKEAMILHALESSIALEYQLFVDIRDRVREQILELQALAKRLALIDILIAFSRVAMDYRYVRPEIIEESKMMIYEGRHPVVERMLTETTFVPNDLMMDTATSILLITGPNMSGKSTYMRQLALIVIMSQIGAFIPASQASLPIFDQIFTRIGALDDLAKGQSTFMVEMLDVNNALKNATSSSLILYDEIGRGTATYDGMALAQAIIEYHHHKIRAKTLFSTHYHELTYLEDQLSSLHNVHVQAREEKGNIVFLHKVKDGPTDRSYGIHVAKLAHMPAVLIKRARDILEELEKNHGYNVVKPQTIDLFNYEEAIQSETAIQDHYASIIEQIKEIDIAEMTPMKAINILASIIERIHKQS
ncbi:MAG: DNA mismatch repair protein MutS [Candidatus Izemoplasmatales bacterium]|nr:DNA mismatch repair protein MutS [Candidatus Izemoplasmatales bacterium]